MPRRCWQAWRHLAAEGSSLLCLESRVARLLFSPPVPRQPPPAHNSHYHLPVLISVLFSRSLLIRYAPRSARQLAGLTTFLLAGPLPSRRRALRQYFCQCRALRGRGLRLLPVSLPINIFSERRKTASYISAWLLALTLTCNLSVISRKRLPRSLPSSCHALAYRLARQAAV